MSGLKTLVLELFPHLTTQHYLTICEKLTKLSKVRIIPMHGSGHLHTFQTLLGLIRVGKSLDNLLYGYSAVVNGRVHEIDVSAFQQMVDAVGDDREQLTVHLGKRYNVPRDLIKMYEPKLRLSKTGSASIFRM